MLSLKPPSGGAPSRSRRTVVEAGRLWRSHGHAAALRDPELFACIRDHSLRVGQYTLLLARGLGLGEPAATRLAAAALLHDVGLLALPAALLCKPGPFSSREWLVIRSHTWIGASALAGVEEPILSAAREISLCHHERWDGTGYPHRLRQEHIPASARIVALADQYDALRSSRPYKPAYGHEAACAVLLRGDGRTSPGHFDPRVLRAFQAVHGEFAALSRIGEG